MPHHPILGHDVGDLNLLVVKDTRPEDVGADGRELGAAAGDGLLCDQREEAAEERLLVVGVVVRRGRAGGTAAAGCREVLRPAEVGGLEREQEGAVDEDDEVAPALLRPAQHLQARAARVKGEEAGVR